MEKNEKRPCRNQNEKEKILAQIAHEIRNPLEASHCLPGLTKEDLQKNRMNTN
jgi:nitrogen-specific signal transduction histidine kinase